MTHGRLPRATIHTPVLFSNSSLERHLFPIPLEYAFRRHP
jgi:hypothetical protein